MGMTEIERFNADWLQAWSDKDVERLLTFYTEDADYLDPQVPAGIKGHDALRVYLTGLFAALPATRYTPEAVWDVDGGYCGRWYLDAGEGEAAMRMRGFDFVQMRDGRISFNEVYTHTLPAA